MSDANIYLCQGIHHAIAKGRAAGEVHIYASRLICVVQSHKIDLPCAGLVIYRGGANNRLIFFAHPSAPDWQFYTTDPAVLKDSFLQQHDELLPALKYARTTHTWRWLAFAASVVLILAIPLIVLSNAGILINLVANQVPRTWEVELGQIGFSQISTQQPLMDLKVSDPLLLPLVTPLLGGLPAQNYEYHFYISSSTDVNAFALPGGIIVINAGLIKLAASPEEMLGVVGHEIAHVRERHSLKSMISAAGTYTILAALFGDATGVLAIITDLAPLLVTQGYSRQYEEDADEQAIGYLQHAGIDPIGLPNFFERLLRHEKGKAALETALETGSETDSDAAATSSEWLEMGGRFLSSHPATEARIESLRLGIHREFEHYQNLDQAFDILKTRVENHTANQDQWLEHGSNTR